MATVKMKRGERIADIFDSPETIAQAEKDGFVRVEEKKVVEKVVTDSEENTTVKQTKRTARQ